MPRALLHKNPNNPCLLCVLFSSEISFSLLSHRVTNQIMSGILESGQIAQPAMPRSEEDDAHGTTILALVRKGFVVFGTDSRSRQHRSCRIVNEDIVKLSQITSTVCGAFSGRAKKGRSLFEAMGKWDTERKENGTATTVKELANYGRGLIDEGDDDNSYIIIGIESKEPKAYSFRKNKSISLSRGYAYGSGGRPAMELMKRKLNDDMSDRYAMDLAEEILLYAALRDKGTGGNLHVYRFDSNGLAEEYCHTTFDLYLKHYNEYEDCHWKTFYMFSHNQIGDREVTNWFSCGSLIQPMNVEVSHPIGSVKGGYIVRRVVLDDKASRLVIHEVKRKCRKCGCHGTTDDVIGKFACLPIENELFHFAELTSEQLRGLRKENADD